MATPQQSSLEANSALLASVTMRSAASRRGYREAPYGDAPNRREPCSSKGQVPEADTQLVEIAEREALAWKTVEKGGTRSNLRSRWAAIGKFVSAKQAELSTASAPRDQRTSDEQIFLDNFAFLDQLIKRIDGGLGAGDDLPSVQGANDTVVPRAYAGTASYLRAVRGEFRRDTTEQFFNAVQSAAKLKMEEVWNLRGLLEFSLFDSLTRVLGRSDRAATNNDFDKLDPVPLSTLIGSLREIESSDWQEIFESISCVDRVLREDPVGVYADMDFETRGAYRAVIAQLAKRSSHSEEEIARQAIALAQGPHPEFAERRYRDRRSHVGCFLLAEGRETLEEVVGYRPLFSEKLQRLARRWPDFTYILAIECVTLAILSFVIFESHIKGSGLLALILFLLPATECAVALVNQFVTILFPPHALPRMDFSEGIPPEAAAAVVVPTLLTSESQMTRAVRDLEVRFLANRDANLHFTLLTDPPDSSQQFDERDALAGKCAKLIEALNEKYAKQGQGSFFLFHRHRVYNPAEGVWMAWERKRGKLLDFNRLLLQTADNFPVKAGDLSKLSSIKYVVTLDADTQSPRGTARKLVGAIAHPLNRAIIDPESNTVVEGYGILQPRVDISIQSANYSRLAALFSVDAGLDIYTRAVSDVYQDLFGEGIFTGKGVYEVAAFQQVLEHRFPCNAILSHDMIEGAYARAGLLSDVEVVDDYPSRLSAYSRRKHRWVRGDWQVIFWLLPRVPDFFGKLSRNPLSVISRWKILDNLRRSLSEIATFVLLLAGWLFLPGKPWFWTAATLIVLALPTYFQFAVSILRAGKSLFTKSFWKNLCLDFAVSQANLFLRIAMLCHQSLVTIDAVVRAVVRMTVTHERLLEWETAAEAESNARKGSPVETYLEITPWLAFFTGLFIAVDRPESFLVALPILIVWGLSKPVGQWLDMPAQKREERIPAADKSMLRIAALRTWRFFREHSNAEENWLVPDTVQDPPSLIVHRLSTTNLGLLLNARQAALDLGFLTSPEFVAQTEGSFESIDRMPKWNGHLYNWYETRTLEPVKPRFISSVDNGNLVCSLWTLKQGCLEAMTTRIVRPEFWRGLLDCADVLIEIAITASLETLASELKELRKKVASIQETPAEWAQRLASIAAEVELFERNASATSESEEINWWLRELSARVSHLQKLLADFMPWILPQHAQYANHPEIQKLAPEKLTLESLPGICASWANSLKAIIEARDASDSAGAELLLEAIERSGNISTNLLTRLEQLANKADRLAQSMDFRLLYNSQKKLLATGYDIEADRLTPSHYDLLASEARAAVFVAIAKGEISQESWFHLERPFAKCGNDAALLSWTGTMFEYLMPQLWMKPYANTLLDESGRSAVRCQKFYAREKSIPVWGISEASCSRVAPDGHYHYEAFGVPALAANEEMSRDLVISPYSTFLALTTDGKGAIENIRAMKEQGWLDRYGFFESIDFTPSRLKEGEKFEAVRCWLAHHQGMSLMAVANLLAEGSSQRRFHEEPLVAATERLLHEKAPRRTTIEEALVKKNKKGETSATATAPQVSQ
jgi:hypothetical protein